MKINWEKLLIIYGFVAPMPILTFMGMTWFSWATILFGLFILSLILRKRCIVWKWNFYGVIFLFTIISSIICLMTNMPSYWRIPQYKNIIWEIMYFAIFMFFLTSKDADSAFFLKGIYYSSIFQMFWGFLQFTLFNVMQIRINDIIFGDLLRMQTRELTQTKGNSIALSGMCWNVGNLVALMCFGYFFCNSTILKLLFIMFSLLSGSRTLLLGMCVCVAGDIYIHKTKKPHLKKKTLGLIVLIGVIIIVMMLSNQQLLTLVTEKINYLFMAFSKDFLANQTSSKIHRRYWVTIGQVAEWNGMLHNLLGWGNGCSGYPFSEIFGQFLGDQWVVECDYINRLWSFGFTGFILWYGWFVKMLLKGRKIDKRYLVLFSAILIEGVTYNAIQGWCYLTLLVIFSDVIRKQNTFQILENMRSVTKKKLD